MARYRGRSLISSFALVLIALAISPSHGFLGTEKKIKSAVFLSPKLVMNPGSVTNSYFFDMDFPRGHFGYKSFNAEVVDESGNSVPLHETYIHHWAVVPYYVRKGFKISQRDMEAQDPDYYVPVDNAGLCKNELRHFTGQGSETRKTSTYVPDPYAIEIDNPEERPDGFELQWFLNIHAIDTRGVWTKQDARSAGVICITSVIPVKAYILDVTDSWERKEGSTGDSQEHDCHVEYDVNRATNGDGCVDVKKKSLMMPFSGYIVYGELTSTLVVSALLCPER
ncbi:unnamed protein product [Microthlaspi erraticum]|uniref:Neprosin domain-containing protein n=1 Tax=Microthlaspi erraticum TaxID=1685480 RepID=A0A6D2JT08_9BRAS|nr:unnamed protein product [Microthlaspi erraticum]